MTRQDAVGVRPEAVDVRLPCRIIRHVGVHVNLIFIFAICF